MTRDGSNPNGGLVEAVFACAAVLALCTIVQADPAQANSPWAFLAIAGFGVLALLGNAAPRLALGLTVLGIFAYYAVGLPPLGMVLPAVGALYLAAVRGRIAWAVGGAVVLFAVATYFRLADADTSSRFTGYEYVTELALAAASIALGVAVRFARRTRAQGERIAELVAAEQRHSAERRLDEERRRISRDLHDTVGHQLTVAALHAAVATEELGDGAPEKAREALDRVRTANAETLRELRRSVRLLRSDAAVAASEERGHGVDADPLGIEPLVGTARAAGLVVTSRVAELPELPAAVATAATGMLTEAVTNVLRHAQADTLRIEVDIARNEAGQGVSDSLRLVVADDGIGAPVDRLDSGHGVLGMRERAALLGGSLRIEAAAERAEGGTGCTVRADIPLGGSPSAPAEGSPDVQPEELDSTGNGAAGVWREGGEP